MRLMTFVTSQIQNFLTETNARGYFLKKKKKRTALKQGARVLSVLKAPYSLINEVAHRPVLISFLFIFCALVHSN